MNLNYKLLHRFQDINFSLFHLDYLLKVKTAKDNIRTYASRWKNIKINKREIFFILNVNILNFENEGQGHGF